MEGPKTLHAITPGPAATTDAENGAQRANIPRVDERVGAVVQTTPTIHNWVQLVYEAFGHTLPEQPKRIGLLGLRTGRSAPTHVPGTPKRPPPPGLVEYGDVLYVAFTLKDLGHEQNVEVFECVIDATKLQAPRESDDDFKAASLSANGIVHPAGLYIDDQVIASAEAAWATATDLKLPDLLEGKCFKARPAPYLAPSHAGNVVLRVDTDDDKPGVRPEDIVKIAASELAAWTANPRGGTKYYDWYPGSGSWCGMFVSYVMDRAGLPTIRYDWVPAAVAGFGSGAWGTWIPVGIDPPEPGDVIVYNIQGNSTPSGRFDHTGLVVDVLSGDRVEAIDGNTSGSGGGSASDGDCMARKGRSTSYIAGFGRPRYAPIIRWGGDGKQASNHSKVGQTVLHHHYFVADGNGGWRDDKTSRYYKDFLRLVASTPKEHQKKIPYLVVSTQYVRTYGEWVKYLTDNQKLVDGPATADTVIRTEGLRSPTGMPGQYIPSFLTEAEVNHLIDTEAAARTAAAPKSETKEQQAARGRRKRHLRRKVESLKRALFQLSFTPSK